MATLTEPNDFPAGIYRIETTDPVLGGVPDEGTGAGLANIPAWQLARRTRWLRNLVENAGIGVDVGPSIADCNAALKNGLYYGTGIANAPNSGIFTILHMNGGSAGGASQIAIELGNDRVFTRRKLTSNPWGDWRRVWDGQAAVFSAGSSGYEILPSGSIRQWGTLNVAGTAANGEEAITFPIAFPAACRQIRAWDPNSAIAANAFIVTGHSPTVSGATLGYYRANGSSGVQGIYWEAIGN